MQSIETIAEQYKNCLRSTSATHARENALARNIIHADHRDGLIHLANTNTIATELKRSLVLQELVADFDRRLCALSLFSTVFNGVRLQGTNKIEVPYYDLDSSASQSFDSATGYANIGNTTTAVREIEIGEGAAQGDRLYQALSFTSQEIARQPVLKITELARQKTNKLASDIFADVLSVITAANFPDVAFTGAASGFDSDDLADIKLACKLWGEQGRGLIIDSDYDANLLKDDAFKSAMQSGSDSAIREGRIFPRVMGFDYKELPTIPDNSENLKGMAFHNSAILVAFAPVPPAEEVIAAGTRYNQFIHPKSGVTLEYRSFGNAVMDSATHLIEANYGFAKGNGTALKRIISAAL